MPLALYYGAIFTNSEWAEIDFTIAGKILCSAYCCFGVALIGVATGALFDGLGEALRTYGEAQKALSWTKLKEDFEHEKKQRQAGASTMET